MWDWRRQRYSYISRLWYRRTSREIEFSRGGVSVDLRETSRTRDIANLGNQSDAPHVYTRKFSPGDEVLSLRCSSHGNVDQVCLRNVIKVIYTCPFKLQSPLRKFFKFFYPKLACSSNNNNNNINNHCFSSVSAMATFYPEANPALQVKCVVKLHPCCWHWKHQGPNIYKDTQMRNKQIFRILGKIPTIAACAYRHRIGRPYNNPVNE